MSDNIEFGILLETSFPLFSAINSIVLNENLKYLLILLKNRFFRYGAEYIDLT